MSVSTPHNATEFLSTIQKILSFRTEKVFDNTWIINRIKSHPVLLSLSQNMKMLKH